MNHRCFWAYSTAVSLGLVLAPLTARAQGFSLNRFDAAEHGSNWFSGESLDLRGHLRPAAGLTLDWAYKPLVAYDEDGDEIDPVIESQLFAHLGGGVILWERLRLGVNVPIALISQTEAVEIAPMTPPFEPQDGASFGDLRLGADVRLFGEYGDVVTLAAGVQLHLPTGDRDGFTGDGGVRLTPRLMVAGDVGMLAYSARVGVAVRTQDDELGDVPTGSELAFVGTAGVRVLDERLLLGPELWGTTVLSDFFGKETTPFELILGGHYTAGDFIFALGVGPGLTRGLGAPGVRVLGSVEWLPAIEEEKPEPEPQDRDGDGILDRDDACPDEKGIASADPDDNGCPPPKDRDGDGIVDDEDACPAVKGVATDDPETNGCPPDRDGDGVYDEDDACPDVKGVASDDPKKNGCPGDRDRDEIVDPDDACPDSAGPPNEDESKHGCPAARVEKGQIKIIERIEFKSGSDKILPESFGIMEAVRAILAEHQEITRAAIEGHTDNVGKAEYNKQLSQRRAEAVMKWLTQKGIERERLEARGFGMERPIADNDTDEGKQTNRRVEFHIRTVNGRPVGGDDITEVEE